MPELDQRPDSLPLAARDLRVVGAASLCNRCVSRRAVAGAAHKHALGRLVVSRSLCGVAVGPPSDQLRRLHRLGPGIARDHFGCVCSRIATIVWPIRSTIRYAPASPRDRRQSKGSRLAGESLGGTMVWAQLLDSVDRIRLGDDKQRAARRNSRSGFLALEVCCQRIRSPRTSGAGRARRCAAEQATTC